MDRLDIVIDVGGVYDAAKLRFDHHQRGKANAVTCNAQHDVRDRVAWLRV